MRPLVARIKPASGFAHFLHIGLQVLLPALAFILVREGFIQLALSIIVLSKWRMFAVRPRFWAANVRANAIDIIVGLSIVLFMMHEPYLVQLMWAVLYAGWLIFIKPTSTLFMISAQAFIGQLCGLMAFYLIASSSSLFVLTVGTGLICFLSARHFFESFEEPYARLLAFVWGYFGAALAWLLSHWLIFYAVGNHQNVIAMPALLLTSLGYGMASLYYLDHNDRLSKGFQKQFIFIMLAIILAVLVLSNWTYNT